MRRVLRITGGARIALPMVHFTGHTRGGTAYVYQVFEGVVINATGRGRPVWTVNVRKTEASASEWRASSRSLAEDRATIEVAALAGRRPPAETLVLHAWDEFGKRARVRGAPATRVVHEQVVEGGCCTIPRSRWASGRRGGCR